MAAGKYSIDGVAYSITVTKCDDGFSASWNCSKCKVSGAPTKSCVSEDEATARSKALLFSEHHFDAHLKINGVAAKAGYGKTNH